MPRVRLACQPRAAARRSVAPAPARCRPSRAPSHRAASATAATIDSPSPLPEPCRERAVSRRTKRSKTCSRASGGTPWPSSWTVSSTTPSSEISDSSTRPAACRTAFSSRLRTSRRSCSRLPRSGGGGDRRGVDGHRRRRPHPGRLLEHQVVQVHRAEPPARSAALVLRGEEQEVADQRLHLLAARQQATGAKRPVGRLRVCQSPPRAGSGTSSTGSAARATRRRRSRAGDGWRCRAGPAWRSSCGPVGPPRRSRAAPAPGARGPDR